MNFHRLFPILVGEYYYSECESFKEIYFSNIMKHFTDGYSDEESGDVTVHHEEAFSPLFKYMTECAKNYVRELQVDPELFDFNIVKCWNNIIRDESIPFHGHGDANISGIYYVNIPEDVFVPLRFHNYFDRIEPFPGFARNNVEQDKWNDVNAYTWNYTPIEGSVLIFPSRLMHDSLPNQEPCSGPIYSEGKLRHYRISIAMDFVLTYKDKTAKALGLQPVSNWRKF